MKKFLFRLKAVLRYKNRLLDTALEELAELREKVAQTERMIRQTRQEFAECNVQLRRLSTEGATPGEIGGYRVYLESLSEKERRLESLKQSLLEQVEAKQQKILTLRTDVSSLEKLQERQYHSYLTDLRKSEEKELEELLVAELSRSV